MGGRKAFIENGIIEPIEVVLDRLCVQQTSGFRDNVSRPGHGRVSVFPFVMLTLGLRTPLPYAVIHGSM